MEKEIKMELRFGIWHDSLELQLKSQGLQFDTEENKRAAELSRDAINTLMLNDIITDSTQDKAFKKLKKIISKHVVVKKAE